MDALRSIWPFVPGHQEFIFQLTGAAVVGLIVLNVCIALSHEISLRSVISSCFTEVGRPSRIQRALRVVLLGWLVLGFVVLVVDVRVNGIQIVVHQT